jgi:hypothetical protein
MLVLGQKVYIPHVHGATWGKPLVTSHLAQTKPIQWEWEKPSKTVDPMGISDGKSIYKWRKFQPRLMTYSRYFQMVCLFIQCNECKWRLCNVISSFQSMCVGLMDLVQQPVGAGLHLHSSCMIPILQMSNGYMGRDQNLWHHMLGDRQFNYHLVMTVT